MNYTIEKVANNPENGGSMDSISSIRLPDEIIRYLMRCEDEDPTAYFDTNRKVFIMGDYEYDYQILDTNTCRTVYSLDDTNRICQNVGLISKDCRLNFSSKRLTPYAIDRLSREQPNSNSRESANEFGSKDSNLKPITPIEIRGNRGVNSTTGSLREADTTLINQKTASINGNSYSNNHVNHVKSNQKVNDDKYSNNEIKRSNGNLQVNLSAKMSKSPTNKRKGSISKQSPIHNKEDRHKNEVSAVNNSINRKIKHYVSDEDLFGERSQVSPKGNNESPAIKRMKMDASVENSNGKRIVISPHVDEPIFSKGDEFYYDLEKEEVSAYLMRFVRLKEKLSIKVAEYEKHAARAVKFISQANQFKSKLEREQGEDLVDIELRREAYKFIESNRLPHANTIKTLMSLSREVEELRSLVETVQIYFASLNVPIL
ncbi:hypothetical protein K502DRAFT_366721 [Neoconidiobolus thromboides FSU 785]|nr:hypothetical protein K502DRAFT_366721 [Neoconidiobolus thromboides FSU 785]